MRDIFSIPGHDFRLGAEVAEWMLDYDTRLSVAVARAWSGSCVAADAHFPLLLLEWTAHGVPWLVLTAVAFLFVCRKGYSPEVQWKWAVLLFGIGVDLALVGVIKLIVRRPRPPYNQDDQVYEAPLADKFSFPSGHTSRATMLCALGVEILQLTSISSKLLMYTFPVLLGLSRVALGRHYITDILAGHVLGAMESLIALELPFWFPRLLADCFPIIFRPH